MERLIVVASASIGLILLVAFIATRIVSSRRRGMSIRLQVFIALAMVVGAFAFGLGIMVIDRIEARAIRFATEAASDKAQTVARLLGAELERDNSELMELVRQLPQRDDVHQLRGVEVYGPHQQLWFRSEQGFPSPMARTVAVEAAIFARGEVQGRVRVVKATIVMIKLAKDFAPTVLVISLVLGAAAALAAAWIGRTIAEPLEALSDFGEAVSSGMGRTARPPIPHGREVMRLTQSLDSMRRQLEGRPFVETFAADLSHELKNPVAAIRASAEVLEESALDEPEQARRFVRRINESVARIERLLSELLGLTRIEAHGIEQLEPIDLGALVKLCGQRCSAPERVQLTITSPVKVRGQEHWLSRAVDNLVDNALLHSPAGSEVQVRVSKHDSDVVLVVSNQGEIPKHARKQLFRRFFTTREDKGGTGLGLAIVRAIAEAHRGELSLVSPGPVQVTFQLTLPAA
jgi:two-component system, OmpR family, sensor histidine kinase CreC